MTTGDMLTALSAWIDAPNAHKDAEAQLWGRVAKVAEEGGEAIAALIGMTGQNPRKGVTHDEKDLEGELFDVAVTALGAVAHIRANTNPDASEPGGDCLMDDFADHVSWLLHRVGLLAGRES
jgi:hypothetical protein